jgi:hypothetical protein
MHSSREHESPFKFQLEGNFAFSMSRPDRTPKYSRTSRTRRFFAGTVLTWTTEFCELTVRQFLSGPIDPIANSAHRPGSDTLMFALKSPITTEIGH